MSLDNFDFSPEKKPEKIKRKARTRWYKCANKKCRAFIPEHLHKNYPICPFCNKDEWITPDQQKTY